MMRSHLLKALGALAWVAVVQFTGCGDSTGPECTCDPETEECCSEDADCPDGFHCKDACRCVEDVVECETQTCSTNADCDEVGDCMGCVDGCCANIECSSDEDCPPEDDLLRYCPDEPDPDTGCRVCLYVRCETDEQCADPEFPLYPDCQGDSFPRCSRGSCICDVPCGGECPGEQYCCRATNTCEPIPDPCADVECPACEQVNPEPGGTLNEETCAVEGADCSCVPLPPLEAAFAGQHSAIALGADGIPVLSGYYAEPYGDLIYGVAASAEAGAAVDWRFVDGVPADAPCEGAADGPRGGIAEPGEDVGWDTDVVVDADGRPRISYHDRTNGTLKYAAFDGAAWSVHTVDAAGLTGRYTSLALDAAGNPVVAYMTLKDENLQSHLKLAWAAVPAPAVAEDWTVYTLDSLAVPCAPDDCAEGQVCLADSGTCEPADDPANCGDCADDEACVAGACETLMPESSLQDLPPGVGLFASLVLYSDGSPAVVYYDSTNGDLKAVAWNGADAFEPPVVLDAEGDVGADCAAFVDSDDVLHVAYQDALLGDLYYWNSDLAAAEPVDVGARDDNGDPTDAAGAVGDLHWVGNFARVAVDPTGHARLAYQDGTSLDLVVATRDPGGVWSLEILARKMAGDAFHGAYGFFVDQVLDGAGELMHISNFKHNLRTDPPSSAIDLRTHALP